MAEINSKYAKIKNEIQKKVDIVSLIEHYVPLKLTGNGYKGLCPFHSEKTPSFSVQPNSENGGFYHCFGCQKSGDAFTFIMEKEGLQFVDAMKYLAGQYGVLWDVDDNDKEVNNNHNLSSRANLLKATEFAANFFYEEMKKSSEAINYFKQRKISGETAKEFRLGFAPNFSNKLLRSAKANGFLESVLIETALIRENETGNYDFFRNRVIFPIFDSSGHPIAFGGRAFGDEKPKYLNSSNTPLYDKSKIFYGYSQVQKEIKAQKTAIIVEGYMDVIMLYQNGIKNVVAACGTSFSDEHAKLLSMIAQKAIVLLDGDEAGINGAKKVVEKLLPFEIDTRYVLIPQNQDPDQFIQGENGKEKFLELIKNAQDGFSFLLDWTQKQYNVSTPSGKSKAMKEICGMLINVKNRIMLSSFITTLSTRYKISQNEIQRYIRNYYNKKNIEPDLQNSSQDSVEDENQRIFYTEQGKMLHLFFHFPQILQEYIYKIPTDFFTEPLLNKLYYLMKNNKLNRNDFFRDEELKEQEIAFVIILSKEKLTQFDKELNEVIAMTPEEANKQVAAKINKFRIIQIRDENDVLGNRVRESDNDEEKRELNEKIDKNVKKIKDIQNEKTE